MGSEEGERWMRISVSKVWLSSEFESPRERRQKGKEAEQITHLIGRKETVILAKASIVDVHDSLKEEWW
jgi:hypothetical protein